jgi:peptide/nickel transport system permease protein
MIPTVFGVIILTFILFNVAGGDPAMLKLGKQATAIELEEYDIQRGLNKPLFWGMWGKTRAFPEVDFGKNAGPWSHVEGVLYTNKPEGRIIMSTNHEYSVPMALALIPSEQYRWELDCSFTGSDRYQAAPALLVYEGSNLAKSVAFVTSPSWRTLTSFSLSTIAAPFQTATNTSNLKFKLAVQKGTLEIGSMMLYRQTQHWYDSQLWFYLKQIATLDMGVSAETNQRVSKMILDGILPSLALTIPMFFVGLVVEVVLALVCAFFRNTFIDRFFVVLSVALLSVNYLVWIVFGQYYFGYVHRWFPVWGFESWRYLILPCCIGIFSGMGSGIRFYRTVMLDEMYKDYVRTAFAKGVSQSGVLFRHVLKNAMIPILTSVVMAIPFLYTGSLLLESFFGIPGLGNLAINALNNSDIDVVRAIILVGAVIYVIANLMTDICYTLVDPRVKFK